MIIQPSRRTFLLSLSGGAGQELGMFIAPGTLVFVLLMNAPLSYAETGLASAAATLLGFLLVLPIGVLVDRVRRGPALVVTALAGATTLASFAVTTWLGWTAAPHLLLAVVLVPILWQAADLARDAYLPAAVEHGRLVPVNATVVIVAELAYWLLPGVMEQPMWWPALAAGVLAACALLFRAIGVPEEPAPPRAGWWAETVEGVRFTFAHPVLRAIAVSVVVVAMLQPLLGELVEPRGNVPSSWLGYLAVPAGAVAVWVLRRRVHVFRLAWVSLLLTQPFAFLLVLAETGWGVWWHALGTFLPLAGTTAAAVTLLSHRQVITPSRLLGRTGATLLLLVGLAGVVSSFVEVLSIYLFTLESMLSPDVRIPVYAWPVVLLSAAGLVAAALPLYRVRRLAEAPMAEPSPLP
ncbi:hypothetical protein SAMN05421869_105179 [Nonomuraea jiangxiensis]|uniref:Major Facilitator Superfamily protein n=2 Tax=Nonomuraea jiangxiensis TaxID=633440 RepID=A0A1G8JT70_9ACTN|nr:hypothetical protein SAMN05421869_105179 [Nonomuraea jiangxiensis]